MYKNLWYVAIRKKRSPMGCKATGMCELVQEVLKPSKVVPGFRLEDIVTLWATLVPMGVGSLHPNRSITHVPRFYDED